jgi:hypothetical protein
LVQGFRGRRKSTTEQGTSDSAETLIEKHAVFTLPWNSFSWRLPI